MSMLSLAPATITDGWLAPTAAAGSFCLFCENGETGLPVVTSVPADGGSAAGAAIAVPAPTSITDNDAPAAANLNVRMGSPLLWKGPGWPALSAFLRNVPHAVSVTGGGSLAAAHRREQRGPARCLTYTPLCLHLNEKSSVAQCVTCGSELHPERAEKYDYCMAPECQEKNLK